MGGRIIAISVLKRPGFRQLEKGSATRTSETGEGTEYEKMDQPKGSQEGVKKKTNFLLKTEGKPAVLDKGEVHCNEGGL